MIDDLSLSVVRKSQEPSSGNSAAASRLMLPLVPRSLHESRLRSLSLFVLSFAGLPVSLQRLVPSPHHPFDAPLRSHPSRGCRSAPVHLVPLDSGSRSLLESQTFLPCSLVTAPRVAFVDASSCPPPARHSVASAWLGGVRAHASCLSAEVNRPPTHASALGSFFGVLDRPGRITLES